MRTHLYAATVVFAICLPMVATAENQRAAGDRTTCTAADITTDGTSNGVPDNAITLSDFSYYLQLWGSDDPAADWTTDGTANGVPDGVVTLSDFSYYLWLWSLGCP